ncbi:MAG TPA: transglycosylase family protein [Baekduia sp.]|nr:transglycosylase family protein [Baekduia sp.]
MPSRRVSARGLIALAVLLAAGLAAACALAPRDAEGRDAGALRSQIRAGKAREHALASAAERLGHLERVTAHEVEILDGRLAEAQSQLAAAQQRLADTRRRLDDERARLRRLRHRLAETRSQLRDLLYQRYVSGRPDLVSVVLDAQGFADLLERMEFLKRVEDSDTQIVDVVRAARSDADHATRVLAALERRRAQTAADVQRERDALAGMQAAAQQRRAALAEARSARLAALRDTRADRRAAQRTLTRLLAARARAAQATTGPGGPWAIPWAVVQCESGGQNLPPNSAGASGYYQMLPSTWKGLGGSTPQAYQAPKAEQDRLAAKLWAGGAGAGNWVCAALVGAL